MTLIHRARDWASVPRHRYIAYVVLIAIAAVLAVVPRPYVARAKFLPQDTSNSAGTSALMTLLAGQSQSFASLIGGGRGSNDLYLIIGRSDSVTEQVIASLHLAGPDRPYPTVEAAKLALANKVDVHLLLGGVLEVEARTYDPVESERLTGAFVTAISKQLAWFGSQIIINKQRIVERRFRDASNRVAQSAAALDQFRRSNNLAEPEAQLGQELTLRTGLQAQLQARLVELSTLQQFSGPENPQLIAVQQQIASLRAQLARTAVPATGTAGPNVAGLSALQSRYLSLFRDYRFAQALYEVYARSAEQVAVEELAAETASYVQVIDTAHLDAARHLNTSAVAALVLLLLMAVFTEWYGPATGLFVWPRYVLPADAAA